MKSLPIIGQNPALLPAKSKANDYAEKTQQFSTWGGKLLQHTDVLYAIQKERVFRPITVQLGPTEACGSHCPFCSVDNRPIKDKIPWDDVERVLRDFRSLGAKALEMTGGGDSLLYRDGKRNANDIIELAHDLGYDIGIITNSEKLSRHVRAENYDKIAWIRISLIKLDEGKTPEDFDYSGFPLEKLGFSYIVYDDRYGKPGTTVESIEKIAQLLERMPGRFVRIAADCLTDDTMTINARWGGVIEALDRHQKFFIKDIGDNFSPYPSGCWVGMLRPYVVSSGTYACTSHVLKHRTYHPTWRLCGFDDIKEAWAKMNERFKNGLPPYEIDIAKECTMHCFYRNTNELLRYITTELPDKNFA